MRAGLYFFGRAFGYWLLAIGYWLLAHILGRRRTQLSRGRATVLLRASMKFPRGRGIGSAALRGIESAHAHDHEIIMAFKSSGADPSPSPSKHRRQTDRGWARLRV